MHGDLQIPDLLFNRAASAEKTQKLLRWYQGMQPIAVPVAAGGGGAMEQVKPKACFYEA